MPASNSSLKKRLQQLGERLAKMDPAKREQVLQTAAKMLKRRDDREVTGQTDLTKPFKACTKG